MCLFPDDTDRNVLVDDYRRCPSLVESRTRISWGVGSLDATLVVVGEAPGAGDPTADRWRGGNRTGMAYTTRHSGRRIRRLFADLGYTEDELYFTNAVKCFPRDTSGDPPDGTDDASASNREPTPRERERCRSHLLSELETVEPACVIATGRHATQSLFAAEGRTLEGFLETVLTPVETETLGAPILPLLHPSYQDVWIARLGYDADGYREAIREALSSADATPASS